MGLKTASGTTLGGGEPRGRDRVRAMDDEELMNSVGLILVLEAGLAAPRRNRVRERLRELGAEVTVIDGGERTYLEVRGQDLAIRTLNPQHWPGVDRVLPLTPPYPHAAQRFVEKHFGMLRRVFDFDAGSTDAQCAEIAWNTICQPQQ